MFDLVRTSLHRAISTPAGDKLLPVRVPKDLARRVNVLFGEPLCSKDELLRRRAARRQLAELRAGGAEITPLERAQAPVQIYHEGDRNARMLGRIKETLDAQAIAYTLLDVAGDQATKEFVQLQAKCKEDELPIVFIGGVAVGGYGELVDWQVSGRLAKAL
jgi:glutaredoxin/antitoxin component of MazEF toxin-antitoxin module